MSEFGAARRMYELFVRCCLTPAPQRKAMRYTGHSAEWTEKDCIGNCIAHLGGGTGNQTPMSCTESMVMGICGFKWGGNLHSGPHLE